jgi:nitric oxide reductase NorQ protein
MNATTPHGLDSYRIAREPNYQPSGDEVALFEAAHAARLPLLLKGPTGCGKTRFVEYMAWKLQRPLITVACHEDLTAADLVGRFLLDADGTVWQDGPLTLAVRFGAICYLDEVVEARADTTVVIHPLTDARRLLPLERRNEQIAAHADFQLVVSYNPGYQSLAKNLKESTRQRFAALEFGWPALAVERQILCAETGIDEMRAQQLVTLAHHSRNLVGSGLDEGISTRMLVHAAQLVNRGVPFARACEMALLLPLSDDAEVRDTLRALVDTL